MLDALADGNLAKSRFTMAKCNFWSTWKEMRNLIYLASYILGILFLIAITILLASASAYEAMSLVSPFAKFAIILAILMAAYYINKSHTEKKGK